MSPIKLVEYLASKKIIIASKLKVYAHILKDKKNCFLININNLDDWSKKINFTLRNYNKLYRMRSNAYTTAKKFEINNRVKKILDFFEMENFN
jgi:glycosyltransferase involved in cell wall biosynthesis